MFKTRSLDFYLTLLKELPSDPNFSVYKHRIPTGCTPNRGHSVRWRKCFNGRALFKTEETANALEEVTLVLAHASLPRLFIQIFTHGIQLNFAARQNL